MKILLILVLAFFLIVLGPRNRDELSFCKKLGDPAECFRNQLALIIKTSGLDAGFNEYNKLYKEGSVNANTCHILTHLLGQETYKVKGDVSFAKIETTSTCSYGFYHGLMEVAFARGNGISTAEIFCWNLKKNSKIPQSKEIKGCFHGIGHGITDYYTYTGFGIQDSIDKGLFICERVSRKNAEIMRYCGVGVFGSTSASYTEGKYSFDMNDPFLICRQQNASYSDLCYTAIPSVILILNKNDLHKSLSIIVAHLPGSKMLNDFGVETISYEFSKADPKNNFKAVVKECQNLPENLDIPCIRGYASGKVTLKQNFEKGKIFCKEASLLPYEREACFTGYLSSLKRIYDIDSFRKICSDLKEFCKI